MHRGLPYDRANMQNYYNEVLWHWIALGDASGGAYVEPGAYTRPQEMSWLGGLSGVPTGLLIRLSLDTTPVVEPPLATFDAANQREIRQRLTDRAARGDLGDLVGRHTPYFRVYQPYLTYVRASLGIGERSEGALQKRVEAHRVWFPDVDVALEELRSFRVE